MKILWLINIMLPAIADKLGKQATNREGWLSGAFDNFTNDKRYEISIAFPADKDVEEVPFEVRGIKCWPFHENLANPENYDIELEKTFSKIIDDVKPDILHIFGTEFPHGLAACRVFGKPERTLVGIQGVCGAIARDYMAMIPESVAKSVTFRDFIKKDSIRNQQEKFYKRAKHESELIKLSRHITGRTGFDEQETEKICADRHYYSMNETMRNSFYEGIWNQHEAEEFSIFLGQGDYPIKGMHFLLEAAAELLKNTPQLHIYIAGNSIIKRDSVKDIIKSPAYGRYLRKLIKDNGLTEHVTTLGRLSEEEIKSRYLKSSVFVCASYVENSPNTIAEAMLLGVPIVTSDAGGIRSIISENEGIIFKRGDVEGLRKAIEHVWKEEREGADSLKDRCTRSRVRAKKDYDGESNHNRLLEIYDAIASER